MINTNNSKKDNQKIYLLENQVGTMNNDFEDMKRTREEAKKQLEAKFIDIYKKIQGMKDDLDRESKRVNDCLKVFQSKFESNISELKAELTAVIDEEKSFVRHKFDEHDQILKKLEQMIIKEREDRLKQTDEQLNPLKEDIANLQKGAEEEKAERLLHEKDILRTISDNAFDFNEKLEKEKSDRNTKISLLKEETRNDFDTRDKLFSRFQNNIINELKVVKDEIMGEMENRFDHQNKIIDNISNFIKTFQDTLKVLGKDV